MTQYDYESRYLRVDAARRVFDVHRDAFRSAEVFEFEKHNVLYKSWIILGHESEVADKNDFVTRRVLDKEILFNRDRNGQVNAFFNSCMHRGPAVCGEKSGNRKSFVCPYHGWAYRNSGELMSTGSNESDERYRDSHCKGGVSLLRVPRLESRAGFYFVSFDADAPSLDDYLMDAGERLELINDQSATGMEVIRGVHEYEIKANYKLLCENSYDGYHLAATHASYVDYLMEVLKGSDFDPGVSGVCKTLGNGHACFETPIRTGRAVAQWLPHWGERARELIAEKREEVMGRCGRERGENICDTHANMVIFPNSIINDQQTVLVRSIIPVSHNRMLVRAWSLAPRDEHPELRAIRLENTLSFLGPAGFATPDDVSMLEWAQKAYESTDVEWNDLSKGFGEQEQTLHGEGPWDDEMQMRAYWTQWDKMMIRGR